MSHFAMQHAFVVFAVMGFSHSRMMTRLVELPFYQLVVFGDTLSDNGVQHNEDNHGFGSDSDGRVWADYLAHEMECPVENYAYSGAKAGLDNEVFDGWSGVAWQIAEYLKDNYRVPDNTLICYQSPGVHDIVSGDDDLKQLAEQNAENIEKLVRAGGKRFLILGARDISQSPKYQGSAESVQLKNKIVTFNEMLNRTIVNQLEDYEHVETLWVDLVPLQERIFEAYPNADEPFGRAPDIPPEERFRYAYFDEFSWNSGPHKDLAGIIFEELLLRWGVLLPSKRFG